MDMETLVNVSGILFRVSIGIFILGMIMVILSFWKMNIREVYLIRSGKAKRRTIEELEAINLETGRLKENIDFDYTTDGLRKTSSRLNRKTGKTAETTGPTFKRSKHSGSTGQFKTDSPAVIRENNRKTGKKSIMSDTAEPILDTAPETSILTEETQEAKLSDQEQISLPTESANTGKGETAKLEVVPSTSVDSVDYSGWIRNAYQTGATGDLGKPAPMEPTVPITIISREMVIHTNECIEL